MCPRARWVVVLSMASFLLLGARVGDGPLDAESSEPIRAGRAWIAERLHAFATSPDPVSSDERIELFASAALARWAPGKDDPHADLLLQIRDRVQDSARGDGSFLAGAGAVEATAYGLTVLDGSARESHRAAADGARGFLRRRSALEVARVDGAESPADVREALDFLRAARAVAEPTGAGLVDGPGRFAGGALDRRSAHAHLLVHFDSRGARITEVFELPRRGGVVQDIHVTARLLSTFGSPRVTRTDGRSFLWPEVLHRELLDRRDVASGAWRASTTSPPSLDATAAALLALDALRPWQDFVALGEETATFTTGTEAEPAALSEDCLDCHRRLQPSLVHQWDESRHAREGVGCAACHGTNHSTMFRENGAVSPLVCGRCHERATREFAASRHAAAEESLLSSALFAATPVGARASCMECHRIGHVHSDGSRGSCNHCHSSHRASAALAREPEACTGCHRGEDYPQDLAYATSRHGALYALTRDESLAPTCVTCHQPNGHHGTGFGISYGSSGVGGCAADETPPIEMASIGAVEFAEKRAEMVGVCAECHSSRFSEQSLRDADETKRYGTRALSDAAEILRDLHREGLLGDSDEALVLGGEQVLLDPARPGSELLNRFYRMWRYQYAWMWKGAYHSSPSVANLESRPGLDADLAWLRASAERLRSQGQKEGD